MANVIRVLIVDDQDIVRQGLSMVLKHEPGIEVIGTTANGQAAVDLTAQSKPDVVLMDLKMPILNGIQATRAITEKFPQTKVIG